MSVADGSVADGAVLDSAVPDGAAPDATPACTSTGETGPVTVRRAPSPPPPAAVTSIVFAHDGDGAMLSQVSVDADGEVTIDVPSCGMVTLYADASASNSDYFLTWQHVQPGDVLVLHRLGSHPASVQTDFPTYPGASSYWWSTGTSSSVVTTSPVTVNGSSSDAEVASFGRAYDATGALAWAGATSAEAVPGPTVVTIDTWHTETTGLSASITGVPDGVARLAVGGSITSGDSKFYIGGLETQVASGSATVGPVQVPAGFGTPMISVVVDRDLPGADQLLSYRAAAAPDTTVVLAYNDLLPLPTQFDVETSVPRPWVTWAAESDPSEADVVIVELHESNVIWWLIAPPSVSSFRLPEVPAGLGPDRPLSPHTIVLSDLADVTLYRDALPRLPELQSSYYGVTPEPFRMSLDGDADADIIQLP